MRDIFSTLVLGLMFSLAACSGGTVSAVQDLLPADSALDTHHPDLAVADLSDLREDASVPELHIPPVPGTPCDDGNACTVGETISSEGICNGGSAYSCDDGRSCTDDSCDGQGDCLFVVAAGHCLLSGICYADQEAIPGSCNGCQSLQSPVVATPLADGASCDDQDACTSSDTCQGGFCSGVATECDDADPCTEDSCSPLSGCVHLPASGEPCGGDGPCQTPGLCLDGECIGATTLVCDDGNACTADSCSPDGGCQWDALDGLACSDQDVCTIGDVCVGDQCQPGADTVDCNDGNECTLDLCHPVSGCFHELNDNPCCDDVGANICDDGQWCTTDSCDPETGACFHDANDFLCNDGDPCTGPDMCADGICTGPPADCDDDNPCTEDSCDALSGCVHLPLDGTVCDDGLDCSTGDICASGLCVADLTNCGCQPVFSAYVNKVTSLQIGADGKVGSGLDVDGDATSCSPVGCEAGIDNALSMMAGLANAALVDAVTGGSVVLLFEHRGFVATGDAYVLAIYVGEVADPACDWQSQSCDYLVKEDSFGADCDPLVTMDNATVSGTALHAGGPGFNFAFPLPLAEGVLLDLVLYHAQVKGTVGFEAGGPGSLSGILGGAVAKQDMLDAIDALPADALPIDKDMVLSLVEMMVVPDIDSTGDGQLNAASIGLPFAAIAGDIVGTTP